MMSLIIFVICYTLFIFFSQKRPQIALVSAVALVATRTINPIQFFTFVEWNIITLFLGTAILAELFMLSKMPAVLAEWVVDRTTTARGAVLGICLLSSILSIFVENVAVVLLIGPIAYKICERVGINPVKPLIFIAIFSNIQGTATLIGDPPSMILASYMNMSFLDFFIYKGKISIFFFVQAGALAGLLVAGWLLRKETQPIAQVPQEKPLSLVPSYLLGLLVIVLSIASLVDPHFGWFAGTSAMAIGILGIVWFALHAKWIPTKTMLTQLDWGTTIFLASVFILVQALINDGWLDLLAQSIDSYATEHLLETFVLILLLSILISAFVDNVPYLLAMIPVVQTISKGQHLELLMFALLIGACLGGNIVPFGASANIVAVGFLKRHNHPVSFLEFTNLGILLTAASVVASSIFLWQVWA